MREQVFEDWLQEKYPKPNSWRTYRSEVRRMIKHVGDFDEIYERDRFKALFKTFEFSKEDGVEPSDSIPHNADPYVTADFRRRCVELYIEFREQEASS